MKNVYEVTIKVEKFTEYVVASSKKDAIKKALSRAIERKMVTEIKIIKG